MITETPRTLLKGEDGTEIEFEILQQNDTINSNDKENAWLNYDIEQLNKKIAKLDEQIDIFTNDADKLDNAIAIASGLLCGLIDSFFVGKFSFEEGMKITKEDLETKIIELAKKHGWNGIKTGEHKGENPLHAAIRHLEKNFKMPSDPLEHKFGGTRQHHLRDFAHHYSIIGLFFSILTQFTGRAYGTDANGFFISSEVPEEMIGKDSRRKYAIAVTDWILHLASDMHGSSATAGAGTGIPGPIASLLKAISALPIWGTKPHIPGEKSNPNSLSLLVAKLYNGTLFAQKDENGRMRPVKIDLRGEKAILQQLGKQSIPVIINEVTVRTFYFIRRLYIALKENSIRSWDDITKLKWRKILPIYNRTINHMLLVASGTFVAVDLADSAIRSALRSGGLPEKFAVEMLLHVNYPGIGRFVIALGTEGHMALRRSKLRTERMALMTELLQANNIKVFCEQKQMWIAASEAEMVIRNFSENFESGLKTIINSWGETSKEIEEYGKGIEKNNPWILENFN